MSAGRNQSARVRQLQVRLCGITSARWGTHPHPSEVEYSGLEPLTSTLPVSRSSQMS